METWMAILAFAIELIVVVVMIMRSAFNTRASINTHMGELDKKIASNFAQVDKRLHGVELTVHPYGDQIRGLETKQVDNINRIAVLEGEVKSLPRIESEIKALRERLDKIR